MALTNTPLPFFIFLSLCLWLCMLVVVGQSVYCKLLPCTRMFSQLLSPTTPPPPPPPVLLLLLLLPFKLNVADDDDDEEDDDDKGIEDPPPPPAAVWTAA